MNLLRDPWVQIRENGSGRRATLKEILCGESDVEIASRRDDMELATRQLLSCIAQCLHTPADNAELRGLVATPLPADVFDAAVDRFADWFELDHPTTPFMQSRGVKATAPTPIQRLFPGLPEGNNHAFFNDPGEIAFACEACIAVALFHQASNCPSFGGGFKGSLRGGAPITTLLSGATLREAIWRNVLTASNVLRLTGVTSGDDVPTWVDQIKRDATIHAASIGLVRGLFWQPAHVEVDWHDAAGTCMACGLHAARLASGFKKEKFAYSLVGLWRHPHGALKLKLEKGSVSQYYRSFTTEAPPWTHLASLVAETEPTAKSPGSSPAPVVAQALQSDSGVTDVGLLVGGYRNNQAAIVERRHEAFRLQAGWTKHVADIAGFVKLGLDVRDATRFVALRFSSEMRIPSLGDRASQIFFKDSEPLLRSTFRALDWDALPEIERDLFRDLKSLARRIFSDLTTPYGSSPKALMSRAVCRRRFERELARIGKAYQFETQKEVA